MGKILSAIPRIKYTYGGYSAAQVYHTPSIIITNFISDELLDFNGKLIYYKGGFLGEFNCLHKTALFILAILAVIVVNAIYQIRVYQELVPYLTVRVDILYDNWHTNNEAWKACKNFNWCEERHSARWPVVWVGEVRWIA